jgi:sugar phosphate isomerase/epimerase
MVQVPHGRPLSISNIAWPAHADSEALDLTAALGFDGVELAPGKVFGDLAETSLDQVRAYRRHVEGRGLAISALQAIFFNVEGVHLFQSDASRRRMAAHLGRVAEVAAELGAKACVFGAPALRDPGELAASEAEAIAATFLSSVADRYAALGVSLCFEANPPLYQCRFVTHTEEAFNLVEHVDRPGIALQLDTGTIFINGENPGVIRDVEKRIGHFHISEPSLVPIGTSGADHAALAATLRGSAYSGWLSIEMKAVDDWSNAVRDAYRTVLTTYGAASSTL